MTEAVDSVMMNIGAFFTIAGGIIMMLFVVGMVGYLVALLWISACNKWRAICRAESLIFEYRKNRKDFLRWMSKADTIAAEKKAADVRPVVRGRWVKIYEDGEPAVDQHQIGVCCSKCMKMPEDKFTESDFCPRCGADMKKGKSAVKNKSYTKSDTGLCAEWKNNKDEYPECTNCGYMPAYDPAIDDIWYSMFCPQCGARMKNGEELE